VYLALADAGLDRMRARELIEAAAKASWRTGTDFREVLAADPEVTALVPADRLDAIRAEVWQESAANAGRVAASLAAHPGLRQPRNLTEMTDEEILGFDGVFIPGGHGPMVDLAGSADVRRVLGLLHG